MELPNRPVRQTNQPQGNGKATASVICGIVSLFGLCSPIIGFIAGIIAIVLGVWVRQTEPLNKQAKSGLIIGIIGLVLSVGMYVLCVCLNLGYISFPSGE